MHFGQDIMNGAWKGMKTKIKGENTLDVTRLKKFDHEIISYASRIKELWISEKYRRETYFEAAKEKFTATYRQFVNDASALVERLENTDFIESEFANCRDQYILAGRSLVKGYEDMARGGNGQPHLTEFQYHLDNGSIELKHIWVSANK
jgi:hypothetical protein